MTQPRPWTNAIETAAVGDFVRVIKGDSQGEEGCIEDLGVDTNDICTITATSALSNMPTVVLESDGDIKPPTVSDVPLSICTSC